MTAQDPTRRRLLAAAALLAGGACLSFAGRVFAETSAAPAKLVVILARGALELGEGFGLHPSLSGLHALHQAGELRFAPAVALPTRIRSHFDAQDILENGGAALRQQSDGWLNRAIAAAGGRPLSGLAVGAQTPLVLRGVAPVSSWAPGGAIGGQDRIAGLLQDLYVDDPLLAQNLARGLATQDLVIQGQQDDEPTNPSSGPKQPSARPSGSRTLGSRALGVAVGQLMSAPQGADVVAVSLDGWDTHAGQHAQLQTRLTGTSWSRTIIIVATEFGRTARINGTQGTDHVIASSLLIAGGALKRGGPIGDWPTLAQDRLFEARDLAPTLDVRSVFKSVLHDHLGVTRRALDDQVFAGSASEAPLIQGLV
ncbi:hypothetical protein LTR94_026162 [Friedmanniomyces endolithicus]|nr:hypothetical protein LTR94_026162 [Friedmanniomyces endolithicus]